jgi:hypothetical protein
VPDPVRIDIDETFESRPAKEFWMTDKPSRDLLDRLEIPARKA